MVFHDLVREERVRPLDRRRGLGGRLLPAREPGAQDRAVRLADRLRRRAADARGRRARGVPRRRLQRADGRARRAPPAPARPLDLHRRPRRHRGRAARPGPAGDPRLDAASTSRSPATSPASTPAEIADRDALRAELGYGAGREGLHRRRRRLGGRHRTCCERAAAAFPEAKRAHPGAAHDRRRRPAHRPGALPHGDGVETRGYVHRLYRQLAACDLAISHGGLSDDDGADRRRPAVPLLPAAPALRAEPPRRPPPRPPRRRPADGLRHATGRRRSPPRWPRRSAASRSYRPVEPRRRRARGAAIGELL